MVCVVMETDVCEWYGLCGNGDSISGMVCVVVETDVCEWYGLCGDGDGCV